MSQAIITWIKGTYTLKSRDRAMLSAYVTAQSSAQAGSWALPAQTTVVERGSGEFTLELPMKINGWPHVSFYPIDGGESFGGVYFGTGGSVLKKWWKESSESDPNNSRSTHGAESSPKFPTLEDQKLADIAWKRLGVELEAIDQRDLRRVKALGYEGGLRVVPPDLDGFKGPFEKGDILVGLHVWPTTTLEEVADILRRDDLAELSPLKYYVMRPDGDPNFAKGPLPDKIEMGRISVHLKKVTVSYPGPTAAKSVDQPHVVVATPLPVPTIPNAVSPQASLPAEPVPAPAEPVAPAKLATSPDGPSDRIASLRYEGRTFGQWQMDFLNRGSQEANALTALEAFAAAGYGEDATSAILAGAFSPTNSIAKRSRKFLSTLPASEVTRLVPKLVKVLETDLAIDRRIDTIRALAAFGPPADSALEALKKQLSSDNPRERVAAAAAIKMIVGKDQYQKPVADVLGKELGIEVVDSNGVWAALPRKDANDDGKTFVDFTEAVIKEQQQLFPNGQF